MGIEPETKIYRAVGEVELSSVLWTTQFSVLPNGSQVKYFRLNLEETLVFADLVFNIDVVAVLEVSIPSATLQRVGDFTKVDAYIFKSGTVEISSELLDDFNNAIISIVHKY